MNDKKAAQELHKYAAQLEHLARTDELTQAYSRRFFMQELEKEIPRATRYDRPLAVITLEESVESLLHRADRALYAAKDAGRNRVAGSGAR